MYSTKFGEKEHYQEKGHLFCMICPRQNVQIRNESVTRVAISIWDMLILCPLPTNEKKKNAVVKRGEICVFGYCIHQQVCYFSDRLHAL